MSRSAPQRRNRTRYVYAVACDGSVVYVGQSVRPPVRWADHRAGRVPATSGAVRSASDVRFLTIGAFGPDGVDDAEAAWIKHAVESGHPVRNKRGRDGVVTWGRVGGSPTTHKMVRVPSDVRDMLRVIAARSRRSMSQQVAALVQDEWTRLSKEAK